MLEGDLVGVFTSYEQQEMYRERGMRGYNSYGLFLEKEKNNHTRSLTWMIFFRNLFSFKLLAFICIYFFSHIISIHVFFLASYN